MKNLLIIDDDIAFCSAMAQAFIKHGFATEVAHSARDAAARSKQFKPDYIVLDLRIGDDSGLALIPSLLNNSPQTRIVVLTGYANIETAVEAIKLGAIHYLSKPVGTKEILEAFERHDGNPQTPVEASAKALKTAERDHILTTFERNGRNISATARELGLHRRTLQRKLEKLTKTTPSNTYS